MTGAKKKLHIATLSDVHLGHARTPTKDIIKSCKLALPNKPATAMLDMIIIAGDLFDSQLAYSDEVIEDIEGFLIYLLFLCKDHNIKLRILEGTPSHDRKQSKRMLSLHKAMGEPVDFKYVDSLSIEHIDEFDMDIFYLPDEWDIDPDDTWESTKKCLAKHGLEKVDMCIMHGQFEHQLPKGINITHHLSERYLSITKHYINIGHVHSMSVHKRILANGSIDRLDHNYESDKGHFRLTLDMDNPDLDEYQFVVNQNATIYKTIDLTNIPDHECEDIVVDTIKDYRDGSYVRLTLESDNITKHALYESLRERYNTFRWKNKLVKSKGTSIDTDNIGLHINLEPINDRTIKKLMKERLEGLNMDKDKINSCLQTLEGSLACG